MPTKQLVYRRGTRGSHTVLTVKGRRLTRASTITRRGGATVDVSRSGVFTPVQSAGESEPSLHLEDYLGRVIASYLCLASAPPKQIRMTASAVVRAAAMSPWRLKNRRRIRLLEKQHKGTLSECEAGELATLETQFSTHLKRVAPRSRDVLDEFAEYVAKMKAKVAAKKKEIKP